MFSVCIIKDLQSKFSFLNLQNNKNPELYKQHLFELRKLDKNRTRILKKDLN